MSFSDMQSTTAARSNAARKTAELPAVRTPLSEREQQLRLQYERMAQRQQLFEIEEAAARRW